MSTQTELATFQCHECPTRKQCLARGLPRAAMDSLSEALGKPRLLSRGEYLYRCGDTTDRLYIVRSGAFKSFTVTASGEEHVTGLHFAGEIIGLLGFTTGVHQDTTIALDAVSVCRVRVETLPSLWSIGCGNAFLQLVGERESGATSQRMLLSQPRADARVAAFALQLSKKQVSRGGDASDLYLPVSKTDLANHLGMTLESLSRSIGRLRKAELLDVQRNRAVILRAAQLATMAGDT